MSRVTVSVIIPVYNGETVLGETLESLERQNYPIKQVFVVDDHSTDKSLDIIKSIKKRETLPITIIYHRKNTGLSVSYNDVLSFIKTSHVVLLVQDCVIVDRDGLQKLVEPFSTDPAIVLTCSKTCHPIQVWNKLPFWQKCLLSHHAGKILSGRNNSFCCYSYDGLAKIGFFNDKIFRTAGEDANIIKRIQKIGTIVDVPTIVNHIHSRSQHFGLTDLFYKRNQHAESAGVILRIHGENDIVNFTRLILRPALLFGLFLPKIRMISLAGIIFYSFFYTKRVYLNEWKNPRVFILPLVNTAMIFTTTWYFLHGLITKKQRL